ncbi:MAG: hypothetical protein ACREME_00410, partial [Gemmatimonadales bacterium]
MHASDDRPDRSRFLAPLLGLAIAAACTPADEGAPASDAAPAASASGDSAAMYADRLMEALGGQQAWDDTRFLAFRWIVERDSQVVADRSHAWDRYDSRYRVEFERGEDQHVAIFSTSTLREDPEMGKVPAGEAWVNGGALAGAARDSALARAYGAFINDTYWLLMP